jgi:hypothetical protein
MGLLTVQQVAALAAQKKPAFAVPWRKALMAYAPLYTEAVAGCALTEPCMLAAIVDRESGGENILQRGMIPGPGVGAGICQITFGVQWRGVFPSYPGYGNLMDPLTNLRVAAHEFLEPALHKYPNDHIAAFAAYNLGIQGVGLELAEHVSPDAWTTGQNYGASVFQDWINFSAVSLNVDVAWSQYVKEAS